MVRDIYLAACVIDDATGLRLLSDLNTLNITREQLRELDVREGDTIQIRLSAYGRKASEALDSEAITNTG